MSRTTIGAPASRDDLLLEVGLLRDAARRHDLDAVRRHHERIVELVEELLPLKTQCEECEQWAGRHLLDCSKASAA